MFRRIHCFTVYECKVLEVLRLLDVLDVKVYTIKPLYTQQHFGKWYISVDVTYRVWNKIKKHICADPQFVGLCGDFD